MGAFSRWGGSSGGSRGDAGALGVEAGADVADRGGEAVAQRGGALDDVGCRGAGTDAVAVWRSHTRNAASDAPTRPEARVAT